MRCCSLFHRKNVKNERRTYQLLVSNTINFHLIHKFIEIYRKFRQLLSFKNAFVHRMDGSFTYDEHMVRTQNVVKKFTKISCENEFRRIAFVSPLIDSFSFSNFSIHSARWQNVLLSLVKPSDWTPPEITF